MYFSSHSSDKQYFSSQKIDENVVFLATTQDKSGLTRRELPCVVTRNETLSGYPYCINGQQIWNTCSQVVNYESDKLQIWNEYLWFFSRKLGCHDIWWYMVIFPLIWGCSSVKLYQKRQNFNTPAKIAGILSWKCVDQGIRWWTAVQWTLESANFICNQIAYMTAHQKAHKFQHFAWILSRD